MLDDKRIKEAEANLRQYTADDLIANCKDI